MSLLNYKRKEIQYKNIISVYIALPKSVFGRTIVLIIIIGLKSLGHKRYTSPNKQRQKKN